ncbi:restriction endonuclease [Oscillatoria sp. FACHB-1406]|nr:restriction endonuclease [Oscillatoria sp. FACHB-1406]MBD2580156.1 restriction endonuclease [Oscillatoria sp. FACHB-1406]
MPLLTVDLLCQEAQLFARVESSHREPFLYGITDGKAVGTYVEHKFQAYLRTRYTFESGNSAKGIDFPGLNVDLKVTSNRQPQSSSPFKSARQKVYGLGYSLLIFVYDKTDDSLTNTSKLDILRVIFVTAERTADYQTTQGIRRLLENDANIDDLLAFFEERMLFLDDIQAEQLAEEILVNPPESGYLTISNALQWRLQYRRIIAEAGNVSGIIRVL